MALSILLVDYKSMPATIEYVKMCKEYLLSKENIEYFIVDNTENASGEKFLITNYRLISNKNVQGYDVVVIDVDGTKVHYIKSLNNTGYARGNNIAASISKELFENNHYLVSNNDVLFTEPINVDRILDLLNGGIAVIGPRVTEKGVNVNPIYYTSQCYNLFWIYVNSILPIKIKPKTSSEIYTFLGCFWFFNSDFYWMVDGFDENTFLYYEESIMAERMKRVEGVIYYADDVEVIHNHDFARKNVGQEIKHLKNFYKSARYYEDNYIGTTAFVRFLSKAVFCLVILLNIPERFILKLLSDIKKEG